MERYGIEVSLKNVPELAGKILPPLPDENFRRVGQSMATASLPEIESVNPTETKCRFGGVLLCAYFSQPLGFFLAIQMQFVYDVCQRKEARMKC